MDAKPGDISAEERIRPPEDRKWAAHDDVRSLAQTIEIRQILRTLWRRRAVIVVTIATISLLGWWIISTLTPLYTAQATLLLEVDSNKLVNLRAISAGLTRDQARIRSELDILRSRELATMVAEQLRLIEDPEFNRLIRPPEPNLLVKSGALTLLPEELRRQIEARLVEKPPAPGSFTEETARLVTVGALLRSYEVYNDGKSYTVQLSFRSKDAQKAATIVNTFANVYLTSQVQQKYDATDRGAAWLQRKIEELREGVVRSERAVQDYREKNNLVDVGGNTLLNAQLATLSGKLVAAQAQRAEAEAAIQGLRRFAQGDDRGVVAARVAASPLVRDLRSQEAMLLRKIAELRTELGPRHPDVTNANSELTEVRQRLKEEVERTVAELESQVQVARNQERQLQSQLDQLATASLKSDRESIELRQLINETDSAQSLFKAFLDASGRATAQVGTNDPDARIVASAVPPLGPSYPDRPLLQALTLLAALVISLSLVVVLEFMDNSYRNPIEIERRFRAPVLGIMPRMRRRLFKGAKHPSIEAVNRPRSEVAEAVRHIHMTLLYSGAARRPKVVLVTSAVPNEGKTSFAVSLARLVAIGKAKVLLIECDLRRPSVSGHLGSCGANDLAEILRTQAQPNAAASHCVDEKTGLHYIGATSTPPLPAELLASPPMRYLIETAAREYDLVVLDSPPVSLVSDALILSQMADATILALEWGRTPRELVDTAIKKLRAVGAPFAGIVLSKVNTRRYAAYGFEGHPGIYGRKYYAS